MSKILVSLANAAEREQAVAALRLQNHTVSVIDPMADDDDPADVASEIAGSGADVAVIDYIADDAAGVKLLQSTSDQSERPHFIFVLPDGVPLSHIIMLMNEGAYAVLEKPIQDATLLNYVERAASGPGRFRGEIGGAQENSDEFHLLQNEAQSLRGKISSYKKLISFLLSTPSSKQHRTALIVSDSSYQRDQLRKILEDHGFQALTAPTPAAGLEAALSEKPRVVISDLEMEGMNGVEFCRELKITNKYVPCHFVICTANSERIGTVMAPGNGVDACVLKPSSESDTYTLISAVAMGLLL